MRTSFPFRRARIKILRVKARTSLYLGMLVYAVASLTSMAGMSIGAFIVVAGILLDGGGPKTFIRDLRVPLQTSWIRRYALASAGLFVAALVSLIGAQFFPLFYAGQSVSIRLPQDLAKFWYFILPLILCVGWIRLTQEERSKVFRAWLFTFAVLSIVGIFQYFTGWPRKQPIPFAPDRFHATLFLGHHLSVASILIFPFFAAFELLFSSASRKALNISTALVSAFVAAGGIALFFTYSRALWGALPFGFACVVLWKLPKKWALAGLALIVLSGAMVFQLPIVKERVRNQMGVGERVELWKANFEFFKHRPVTGVGFLKPHEVTRNYFAEKYPGRTDIFVGHAHNLYLEILSGTGILGLAAWLFWLGIVLGALFYVIRAMPSPSFGIGLAAAWLVFLINGLTQVNFWEGKVLHQVMWTTGMILFWASPKAETKRRS